ncbi:MAG: ABC transporter substrate-binding protein, partial [Spirochaetota bacterium]|nr:ABC transporter substrate-binding protein [Spirochaetota bacterium]
MRRNIINISFILFLFTFIFFLADSNRNYLFSAEVRGVTNNTIKLGVIADMTGPASDIWLPVTDGIKTHFMSVNDNGGINGRKVKIIIEDDRFSIPLALSAFKKLLFRDKVLTICGTSGQGHTYAVIPKMEQARMPLFAVIADHKYVIPARKYIFGVLPYYDDQIKITFEYIHNDLKAKKPKISFLYMDSGSSKPLIPLVRRLAKKYRVKLSEIIIPISGIDMTSEVLRLKKEDPDYVIMNAYIGNSSAILRTAKKFNFRKPFFV